MVVRQARDDMVLQRRAPPPHTPSNELMPMQTAPRCLHHVVTSRIRSGSRSRTGPHHRAGKSTGFMLSRC